MINNRDCFFYKKSDFINRLQDISPDSVCYIADTQQIYTHGRYFECNVTQDVVEQLIQNHGYLTAADLPVLTGGASPTPGEYVTGVSVGGHNINVQKGKLSEINVGTASKLETPRKIELSGDLSGSIMFDGSQDVTIETIVNNSTTADRLTTPRTISLSSQATGQVSFDGSGNVNIPVTVNELDSKNSNNQDLNSLVTLNGYGGSLFYGQGGNTSVNKPSGVDWFGLFSFKSASGNYTTQILGSKNRLYSRSNADTSLGSWNTIAYLTDNVASATKLKNTRTFTISDGTNSGTASNFDGTGNVTLRLPSTIHADIIGNVTGDIIGDITGDITGDLHGNADTATKLQTGRNINGTLFDGTQNIITAQWGTARNIGIVNSDGTGTAVPTSVNGSVNVNLRLPATIKANLQGNVTGDITGNLNGNASTASKLQTARTITLTGDATGSTSFNGSANVSIAVDVNTASKLATARTITLTGDASGSASFDGSANISIPVTIANDSHTHATSASSNATTNLTITAGGTTATIADLYATYADRLRTARTISLTGDATGSASFNGAANISIPVTVANDSHTHTFANITNKPIRNAWNQGNNNNITTKQFLDLLTNAGAFSSGGWFHARGEWSYAITQNITDTGYGTIDLAGCAISVFGSSKEHCTIMVIPPLNASASPTVELGTIYLYITNGEGYTKGWRKIARFEDINWDNVTNKPASFTPSSHTHPLSQISNLNANWDNLLANTPSAYLTRWPSISEVTGKQNLVIRLNGGTTEGTNQFTYNSTAAKTLSITPSNIGAATSSHTHNMNNISDASSQYVTAGTVTRKVFLCKNKTGNGWVSRVALGLTNPTGKFSPAILSVGTNDGGTSWYDYTFTADGHITNSRGEFALVSQIPSLSGYATQSWVQSQGYLTSVTWDTVKNKPSWIGSSKPSYSWSEISGKPSSFTPSSHTHSASDITSGTLPISRGGTGATTALAANYNLLNGFTRRDYASFVDSNYIAFFTNSPSTTVGALQGAPVSRLYNYIVNKLTPSAIGAAASSHTHSASNITSGTLSIARIPTGTTVNTVALGSHTHSQYLTSSDLSNYVTESELSSAIDNITPASIGAASSSHTHGTDKITLLTGYVEGSTTTTLNSLMSLNTALASLQNQIQTKAALFHTHGQYIEKDSGQYTAGWEGETDFIIGEGTNTGLHISLSGSDTIAQIDGANIITEDNYQNYISTTDTRNTTGTSNSTSKLYLVGGLTQNSTGVVTYSNSGLYTKSGSIYANNFYTTGITNHAVISDTAIGILSSENRVASIGIAGIGTNKAIWVTSGVDDHAIKTITLTGGTGTFSDKVNSTNGFYETSDARLKDFKEDVKALDTIDQIPTKYFTWKEDENQESQIGTSAQEVEKLYPELVSKTEDDTLTVDYAKLSIIALAAIKELKTEIQSLKEEIKQLKSK